MKHSTCHPPRAQQELANCVETEVMLEEAPCYHIFLSVFERQVAVPCSPAEITIRISKEITNVNSCHKESCNEASVCMYV